MNSSIIDYFDVGNYEHLKAFQHLSQVGVLPKSFYSKVKNLEFPPNWQIIITGKLATCYVNTMLYAMEFGKEKENIKNEL